MSDIIRWGTYEWGNDYYWGSEVYNFISPKRNINTAEQDWDSPIDFAPQSNMYSLVSALLTEADRVDADIERIYEQQHINSASGEALDQFGELADVERKTDESDEKYRARVKAAIQASITGTTFDEFTQFCASILDTNVDNLSFETRYPITPATVIVRGQRSLYQQSDLTAEELIDILGSGVPAGHAVEVIEEGSFEVRVDGETDDPDKGLTSDTIETGGTLASDLE